MRMRRLLTIFVALCSLGLLGSSMVLAQDASPEAAADATSTTACTIESPTVDELLALWYQDGTQVPFEPDEDLFPISIPVPLGEPADAETVAAVTALMDQVVVCSNTGEPLSFYGFLSDRLDAAFGPESGESIEDARAYLEGPAQPLPADEQLTIIAITDVSIMEDGRVGAFLISDDPSGPPEGIETELVFFIQEDGQWVVDGIAEFTQVDEDSAATPESD